MVLKATGGVEEWNLKWGLGFRVQGFGQYAKGASGIYGMEV